MADERRRRRPLASQAIRRDLAKLAKGVHPRVLLDAASRFSQFTGPVRILWGEDDPFFRAELGRQLSEAFPRASLATVPAGRTFLPLGHPGEVASEIAAAAQDAAHEAPRMQRTEWVSPGCGWPCGVGTMAGVEFAGNFLPSGLPFRGLRPYPYTFSAGYRKWGKRR